MRCPDLAELECYTADPAAGGVSPVARHVESCATCSAVLDDLRRNLELAAELRHGAEGITASIARIDAPGNVVGYRIRRAIRAGAQGAVYEALQLSTGRVVALKFLRHGPHAGVHGRRRFLREIELLTALRHPNVVTVLDGGESEGWLYFAMEFVDGEPLADRLTRSGLRRDQALRIFLGVCRGVQHAHQRGVIHRDLKPQNILLDTEGEPRVIDFGLAKPAAGSDAGSLSRDAGFVGTLAYAAPEQLGAGDTRGDVRSDVYALGVILCELLTGRHPFAAFRGVAALVDAIEGRVPTDPRISTGCGAELTSIVRRAMERDPDRRYPTVESLAADVLRYQRGEPVEARRHVTGYVLRKTLARHRVTILVVTLVFVALLGATVVTLRSSRIAEAQRAEAALRAQTAERVTEFLAGLLQRGNPNDAGATLTMRDALELASRTIDDQLAGEPEVQAEVLDVLGRSLIEFGLAGRADQHLQRALELRRSLHGPRHESVARSLNLLGFAAHRRGDLGRARSLYEAALGLRRELLGRGHPEVAQVEQNLAAIALTEGDLATAETLLHSAERTLRAHPDAPPEDLAAVLQHLADLDRLRGAPSPAEERLAEALALLAPSGVPTEVAAADVLYDLAGIRHAQGRLGEARELYQRTLAIYVQRLDPLHPFAAAVRFSLGAILLEQGHLEEAEDELQEALAIRLRSDGPSHPNVAMVEQKLGTLLLRAGRSAGGEDLLHRALRTFLHVHGPDHELVASARVELARALEGRGLIDEALTQCTLARDVFAKQLGGDHAYVAVARRGLVRLLLKRDCVLEAWAEIQALPPRFTGPAPEDGAAFLDVALAEATCLRAMGRARDAVLVLSAALDAASGPARLCVADALNETALVLRRARDYAASEPPQRRALDIYREALGDAHPWVMIARSNLARLLHEAGRPAEALEELRRAIDDTGESRHPQRGELEELLAEWRGAARPGG